MRLNGLRLGLLFCFLFLVLTIPATLARAQISHLGPPKHPGHGAEEPGGGAGFVPQTLGPTPCVNGFADVYPCSNVDLESFMTLTDLGAEPGERAAGIWGWTDPETRREYALIALRSRVSFVDITDPRNPRLVGDLPGVATGTPNREVNVLGNWALVVADGTSSNNRTNGVQFFNLTQLRGASGPPVHFTANASFSTGTGRIHNIAVNTETGFAYAVGGDCRGGLQMIDVGRFTPVGCWPDPVHSYIHDTQCVIYRGPDQRFTGRELCFASAEDALLIVDVTNKSAPQKISRTNYENFAYSHQGWLTGDHQYFLMDDESDEAEYHHNTRTLLWDLSDLTAPRMFAVHEHSTGATDHNQYVRGDRVYQSNYRAGLRILDISRIAEGTLKEVGFFDVVPDRDDVGFDGAWGNYPFFPSGTVVVGGINQGLYILKPQEAAPEPTTCKSGPDRLCFQGNRFLVEASWRNTATGESGKGTVLKKGTNFGVFTLGSGHADLLVRMTQTGQEVRLLYSQLTNLQISVSVTDTKKGGTTYFYNGAGTCGVNQQLPQALISLPADIAVDIAMEAEDDLFGLASQPLTFTDQHAVGTCKAAPTRLCLHGKRFQVELTWKNPTTGAKGTAKATKITDDSGTFAFKAATGAEVAVKAVETDRARIVWGSLTSFEFTLKVTDTVSRQVKTYVNPAGTFCGGMDEEGF